jgi:hypothetical protein
MQPVRGERAGSGDHTCRWFGLGEPADLVGSVAEDAGVVDAGRAAAGEPVGEFAGTISRNTSIGTRRASCSLIRVGAR